VELRGSENVWWVPIGAMIVVLVATGTLLRANRDEVPGDRSASDDYDDRRYDE
jgi:hypothetical protein